MNGELVERRRKNRHYHIMLAVYAVFILFALILDTPEQIFQGFLKILTSRSVLLSDYMAIGGVGATLFNASIVGCLGILLLMRLGIRPNGSTLMSLWLSTGFAMFGKNPFNMIPITFGVWLYTKMRREPVKNYALVLLLSATLSPVVSGIAFHPYFPLHIGLPLGILMGIVVGFVFPPVTAFTVRVHGGYDLYNMGFSGGLISTFIVSGFSSVGIPMENELHWSGDHKFELAVLMYVVCFGLMLYGLFAAGKFKWPDFGEIMRPTGRLVTDTLISSGYGAYVNMGLLGAFATTVTLVYGAELNGATMCGIFTIVGFGAFGKHPRNVIPVLMGALICTYVNHWDPATPSNTLAILFSTGLAPIAGQFGIVWGVITGFLHVNTVMHIGFLNSGLNLYNNGYAAGFVAMLLVPFILSLQKDNRHKPI